MGGEEREQKIEGNKMDTGYREGAGEERGESHGIELPGRVGHLGLGDREVTQTGASPTQPLDHLTQMSVPNLWFILRVAASEFLEAAGTG